MMPFGHLLFVGALLVISQQYHLSWQSCCHAANIAGSAANGPRIEIKPAVPIVHFEAHAISSKVLTCKALGDKPGMFNQLRWSGPDRMDNWDELSKKHKVRETTRNGYSVELDFQRPSPDDSGTYYCQGTYQSSDYYNASIQVKVYNPIKMENCPERQFVVENATGQKITCHVTGDGPTLVLYKDENPIDGKRYKWDNEDGIQIMGPVDKTDAGVYAVEVTTEVTGDRRIQYVTVEVHSKPDITPYTPSQGAIAEASGTEGERAELKCEATGNPKPLVYWLDPKLRNLTSVGGYHVNPVEGTLIIDKVNRFDDNGNFQCVAYNHVGDARRIVPMMVLQRPNIVAFENKTVEDDSVAILECRATGSPKPTFSIRRQGLNQVPYFLGDQFVKEIMESEEGGGAQVHVYRVRVKVGKAQFGLHYCNATNNAGSSERVGQLNVRHRPDLSQTPVEQYMKLGKNVTVTCHIKAYPEPIVTWYNEFEQQILNAPINVKPSPDGQTFIVTMMPPPSLQGTTGRYKCQATNDVGITQQIITTRYTTAPGTVNAVILEKTPTTIMLQLTVSNDGGDRVRAYKYRIDGITRDTYSPFSSSYPIYRQNETSIDALTTSSTYTIRNLLPKYSYRITIRAINEVGEGDVTEISAETTEPSRPEPPMIIKSNTVAATQTGFTSDYQNGYVLKWSPPDLDNGDPVTRYVIKINKVNPDSPDISQDDGEQRIIEQSNERPLHARIGPLEINQHYRIQLLARNKYGDSEPAKIIINTNADRPMMPDFGPQALTWFTEPSTPVLVGLLILAIVSLIIIDIMFCLCFQIGVSHIIRNCCCPAKANSVISDKTYT